jgi:phenylacetate-CoA ligase
MYRQQCEFLRKSQNWSADCLQAWQLAGLQKIVRLAWEKSPWYRRLFTSIGFHPDDLKSFEDFRRLPTIDRNVVRENLLDMCSREVNHPGVDRGSTGGTGGEPLVFYMGRERSSIEYAYLTTSWKRIGYAPGTPLAVFRGQVVPPDHHGFRHRYDPLLHHHYYSNFHMTDDTMQKYLSHVATIGPCFLHVYPSSAEALARCLKRHRLTPPNNIRGILSESEIVYPHQRDLIQSVFGRPLFSLYGHSEKLVLASECEYSTLYHVWPTYGYFELLDEKGQPITESGRRGEIVGTGFLDPTTLFIRYRTGDAATWIADHCDTCGRHHPIITDIRGHRVQEFLIADDGSEISWTAMNMHDDTFDHVRRFQFYQDSPGRGILRLIPTDGFCESDRKRILHNLDQKFSGRFRFTIELHDTISLSPRGKAIYVDQHIPQPQRATEN